jgi:hypothetical protein
MNKPAAVIDKSLLQAICEQDSEKRNAYYRILSKHYQVVVALVLVEEIWVNIAKPNKKTPPTVLANMRDFLRSHGSWIDDPLEIAFTELVKGEPVKPLPRPANNLEHSFSMLRPDEPALVSWVTERTRQTESIIRQRVKEYADILPTDKFASFKNGRDFFEFIRVKFVEMLGNPSQKQKVLEGVLGLTFRANHPELSKKIDKAFDAYSSDTFEQYQAALNCIIAAMFYRYAPLCKIAPTGDRNQAIKILGRGFQAQFNNLADERYVQSALLCDRLLTCDEGMHKVMTLLKDCGFWDGISVFIDPKKDLEIQITRNLI